MLSDKDIQKLDIVLTKQFDKFDKRFERLEEAIIIIKEDIKGLKISSMSTSYDLKELDKRVNKRLNILNKKIMRTQDTVVGISNYIEGELRVFIDQVSPKLNLS